MVGVTRVEHVPGFALSPMLTNIAAGCQAESFS